MNVAEGAPPAEWASLPDGDRVLVGGHTVWTGPFRAPIVVAQPNRWGVIEDRFPDLPCVVESDPVVTGCLPLPAAVLGFVDRAHRPIDRPGCGHGRSLMDAAASLAAALTQIKGVKVAATPFARTIPLLVPRHPQGLIEECARRGVVGIRPLPGLGGGIALSVRAEHGRAELERIRLVLETCLGG